MRTYVAERQIEYWTSRQIEDFFAQQGYECIAYPVSQAVEKHLPADFIFHTGPIKLFGLQYKALYHNTYDCWLLESNQHSTLAKFPWIYYGLSDIKQISEFRSALYALRVKNNRFAFQPKLATRNALPYRRWWAFYKGLLGCSFGSRADSPEALKQLLSPPHSDFPWRIYAEFTDLFLMSPQAQRLVHLIMRPDSDKEIWHVESEKL